MSHPKRGLRHVLASIVLLLGAMSIHPVAASAGAAAAPTTLRQMNPIMLRHLDPAADTAIPAQHTTATTTLHMASIFLADRLPDAPGYLADMEILMLDTALRIPFGRQTELRLDLPVAWFYAGVLDPALRGFHQNLHLPDNGRHTRPDNRFGWRLAGAWQASPGLRIGNPTIRIKRAMTAPAPWLAAVSLDLFAPIAPNRELGHGVWETALGLLVSRAPASANFQAHAGLWWIHPWKRRDLGRPIKDYMRLQFTLGTDWPWLSRLFGNPSRAFVQVQGGSSPWHSGMAALDAPPFLVGVGIRQDGWSLIFEENITQNSTQDFGLLWSIQHTF